MQSSWRCHGWFSPSPVSRANQKQKHRGVVITSSIFISRSKDSRIFYKHVLHFAALGSLRTNKRERDKELQTQNYTIYWPWTCTNFQLLRVCETLHKYVFEHTILIQQVSNTSACTVANRVSKFLVLLFMFL